MKIIDVRQGSDEWAQLRGRYHTASEASVMMGASKQVKRSELVRMKATGDEQEFSDWVRENLLDKGHEIEAMARPIAEDMVGEDLFPVVAISDDGTLLASYDGLKMLEDGGWECKSWNEAKAASVREGRVPEEDYWQIVQQLAVGVDEVLYMVTHGTTENTVSITVHINDVADDIEKLRAGWKQFDEDVANYQHVEEAPKPEGRAPDQLPSLHVELTGMVTHSNLAEFKSHALAVIGAINRDLKTDEDFSNAEKTVKWCSEVESRLKATKEHALGQTKSIDELFRTIDAISDETRKTRLELDKLVKARKDAMRAEILQGGKNALAEHIRGLNERIGKPYMPDIPADFAGAMKGKKTISSLRDAVDTTLAHAKIEANQIADRITLNLKELQVLAHAHMFLFSDLRQIVTKPQEDFVALVKSRIADHREAEAKREAEHRERIAAEERARIEREEREKIAAEQRAQAQRDREEQERISAEERERIEDAHRDALSVQAEEREKAAQESAGNDVAEATHADDFRDQRPQAPAASSTPPTRPPDNELVAVIANEYHVSMEIAWAWLENFGQEVAA